MTLVITIKTPEQLEELADAIELNFVKPVAKYSECRTCGHTDFAGEKVCGNCASQGHHFPYCMGDRS